MKSHIKNFKIKKFLKAFTIAEILASLSIIVVISAIIISSLSSARNTQALKGTTDDVLSLLTQARTKTLSGYNDTQYGVYLSATSATLFTGASYIGNSTSNQVSAFDSVITIDTTSTSLNAGGTTVLFDRLTGGTNNYGTILINITSSTSTNRTITVSKTGNVSSN